MQLLVVLGDSKSKQPRHDYPFSAVLNTAVLLSKPHDVSCAKDDAARRWIVRVFNVEFLSVDCGPSLGFDFFRALMQLLLRRISNVPEERDVEPQRQASNAIHQSTPRTCSRLLPDTSNFRQRVSYLWGNGETKATGTSGAESDGQSIMRKSWQS
ncbi:hypothetical protein E1301_Tti016621 [Triplophysa tibetana]|uniref:Uncharacterized protein n=1 Tax=Triplophysa tibetana TaxID=1572043 RepID=A0A5A9NXQ3_9TELE|nr:hypothetical protein E1301_Tti016621 [Triplophysa tibetana]